MKLGILNILMLAGWQPYFKWREYFIWNWWLVISHFCGAGSHILTVFKEWDSQPVGPLACDITILRFTFSKPP
jgi:hypothetical protein